MTISNDQEREKWKTTVLSVLEGSDSSNLAEKDALKVKKIQRLVLLSLQLDDSDKASKKLFKAAIQALEQEGTITLDSDGIITLLKKNKKESKKRKKDKKEKKSKQEKNKRQKIDDELGGDDNTDKDTETQEPQHDTDDDNNDTSKTKDDENAKNKNKPCKGNPLGVTRLFLGNLPFAVDETALENLLPGITHIKWITDKETGKFYGSAFIELESSVQAAAAVAKAGEQLMGRPVKINFAPARPGEKWPPEKKVISGGGSSSTPSNKAASSTTGGKAGGIGVEALGPKPDGCLKLFIGNLSYEIDDDAITKFFANVDAELKAVRWIHHKDSGDFKGVGFAEFWNTEACEKAAALNGKNLLGRPIRIDWSD